jgi:hypothetical protein
MSGEEYPRRPHTQFPILLREPQTELPILLGDTQNLRELFTPHTLIPAVLKNIYGIQI